MTATPDRPLAEAQRRLGKPGRPRKAAPDRHTTGTPPSQTRIDSGPAGGAVAQPASALFPRLLDVDGAAGYLAVSTWTIRDLHASGRLPRVKLPLYGDRELRRLLFDVRDLDRLVEASKESAS